MSTPLSPMSPPGEGPSASPKKKAPTGPMLALGIGVACLFGLALLGATVLPVFLRARRAAQEGGCIQRLGQIGHAMTLYEADYDGQLPVAKDWMTGLRNVGLRPRNFRCPSVATFTGTRYGYGFNIDVSGQKADALPPTTVVVFDSSLMSWNANSRVVDTLPIPPRHAKGRTRFNNFLMLDGSVKPR